MTDLKAYSVKEAAKIMGCSLGDVFRLIEKGELRYFDISLSSRVHRRIRGAELEEKRPIFDAIPPPRVRLPAAPKPLKPPMSRLASEILALTKEHKCEEKCFVYFVACDAFVKIGHSRYPRARVEALRSMTPYPIEFLKMLHGGPNAERAIHGLLKDHHHHFEWFHLVPELAGAIKELPGRRRANV